jgi:hypothetical protein
MANKTLSIIIFALLLIGCKKETTKPTVPIAEEALPDKTGTNGSTSVCYLYNEFGSVVSLELDNDEGNASGSLMYGLKGKDSNHGVFVGQIKDSILIADYTFVSEGIKSKRQVAFKLKGDQLFEGYGEMNEDGTKFKDASKLEFNLTMPLSKTVCPK